METFKIDPTFNNKQMPEKSVLGDIQGERTLFSWII